MIFIKQILHKWFINFFSVNKQLLQLGRWNIDYCSKKINRKIDLSNVDHCGPCGQNLKK
jgi:hypothetical protein